jgi:hypothetical protein
MVGKGDRLGGYETTVIPGGLLGGGDSAVCCYWRWVDAGVSVWPCGLGGLVGTGRTSPSVRVRACRGVPFDGNDDG